MILLIDDDVALAPPSPSRLERQANLRQALATVAQAGTFAHIDDASVWQRELRAERPQPAVRTECHVACQQQYPDSRCISARPSPATMAARKSKIGGSSIRLDASREIFDEKCHFPA